MLDQHRFIIGYTRSIENLGLTMISPAHREIVPDLAAEFEGEKQHKTRTIFIRGENVHSLLDLLREFAGKDHTLEYGHIVKAADMQKVNECPDTAKGWLDAVKVICMAHPYNIVLSLSYSDSKTKNFMALAQTDGPANLRLVLVR
jgi:hypothetical protein